MYRLLNVFIVGVFLIYTIVCSYRIIRYEKYGRIIMRFMTSCIILFIFTIVCYENIFFNGNETNWGYSELTTKHESKVFSSYDSDLKNDCKEHNVLNKQKNEFKITAYFDNANPSRGSITNLIVTGPPKGSVTAICQFKGHGTPYIMPIGANGLAVIPVKVESDAELGLIVVVDITVSYNGKLYKLNSVFTPQ